MTPHLVDPLNYDNNVTKGAFQMGRIQSVLQQASIILKQTCGCLCHQKLWEAYKRNKRNDSTVAKPHCSLLNRLFTLLLHQNSEYSGNS